jgi:hypothetical protein
VVLLSIFWAPQADIWCPGGCMLSIRCCWRYRCVDKRKILLFVGKILIQDDQKVFVHLMITIQKVTSNVQSVPRQSPDIYRHAEPLFSKTVFTIARSTFRMYSVMVIFKSSIVWRLFEYADTFWLPCRYLSLVKRLQLYGVPARIAPSFLLSVYTNLRSPEQIVVRFVNDEYLKEDLGSHLQSHNPVLKLAGWGSGGKQWKSKALVMRLVPVLWLDVIAKYHFQIQRPREN